VQRNFIQRLLTFTTFQKHMAAVRETHSLLRCAVNLRDRPRLPESSDGGTSIQARGCLVFQCCTGVGAGNDPKGSPDYQL